MGATEVKFQVFVVFLLFEHIVRSDGEDETRNLNKARDGSGDFLQLGMLGPGNLVLMNPLKESEHSHWLKFQVIEKTCLPHLYLNDWLVVGPALPILLSLWDHKVKSRGCERGCEMGPEKTRKSNQAFYFRKPYQVVRGDSVIRQMKGVYG